MSAAKAEYFMLSDGQWVSLSGVNIYTDRVRLNYYASGSFRLDRATLKMTTNLNIDLGGSLSDKELECSLHSEQEITQIATREWQRIESLRKF